MLSGLICQMKCNKEMGEFRYIHCILFWARWTLYMAEFQCHLKATCSSKELHLFFKKKKKKEAFGLPLVSTVFLHPLFSTASIFSFDQSMTTPQMMVNSICRFVSLGFRKHESKYMYVYSHICILTRKYLFSHRETLTYVAEEPEASKRFSVSEREPKWHKDQPFRKHLLC